MHFVKLLSALIKKEIHIICKIIGFILKPFIWAIKRVAAFGGFVSKRVKKVWKYMKKKLTAFVKMLKMGLCKH